MLKVWKIHIPVHLSNLESFYEMLSVDERERADRFLFPEDRQRFVVSHFALRDILATCFQIAGDSIKYSYNKYGKPSVENTCFSRGVSFNLSHSGDYALVVIGASPFLGVDIEQINEHIDYASISKKYFSHDEYLELKRLPQPLGILGFHDGWVRKEAFVKSVGTGVQHGLSNFTVSMDPLVDVGDVLAGPSYIGWSFHRIHVDQNYRAAFCVFNINNYADEISVMDWGI